MFFRDSANISFSFVFFSFPMSALISSAFIAILRFFVSSKASACCRCSSFMFASFFWKIASSFESGFPISFILSLLELAADSTFCRVLVMEAAPFSASSPFHPIWTDIFAILAIVCPLNWDQSQTGQVHFGCSQFIQASHFFLFYWSRFYTFRFWDCTWI